MPFERGMTMRNKNLMVSVEDLIAVFGRKNWAKSIEWISVPGADPETGAINVERVTLYNALGGNQQIEERLFSFVERGNTAGVRLALQAGASVNARDTFFDDMTPLMMAARMGHISCINLLLNRGADVTATYEGRWDALMLAANSGHALCIPPLLNAGADPKATNPLGHTARDMAANNLAAFPAVDERTAGDYREVRRFELCVAYLDEIPQRAVRSLERSSGQPQAEPVLSSKSQGASAVLALG